MKLKYTNPKMYGVYAIDIQKDKIVGKIHLSINGPITLCGLCNKELGFMSGDWVKTNGTQFILPGHSNSRICQRCSNIAKKLIIEER